MKVANENRFRRILKAKRDEVVREIQEQRERLFMDQANDPMDEARFVADRELVIRSLDRLYDTIRCIDVALDEIRDRTFGICARCGDNIPLKRLEAVPWSPFCVACQEWMEVSQGTPSYTQPAALFASQ